MWVESPWWMPLGSQHRCYLLRNAVLSYLKIPARKQKQQNNLIFFRHFQPVWYPKKSFATCQIHLVVPRLQKVTWFLKALRFTIPMVKSNINQAFSQTGCLFFLLCSELCQFQLIFGRAQGRNGCLLPWDPPVRPATLGHPASNARPTTWHITKEQFLSTH